MLSLLVFPEVLVILAALAALQAVFPVALRMVHQVTGAVDIPVIGMGGVTTARDVIEMMMAGAKAVQIGAANLVNPMACPEILAALPGEMEKLGIRALSEIERVPVN